MCFAICLDFWKIFCFEVDSNEGSNIGDEILLPALIYRSGGAYICVIII